MKSLNEILKEQIKQIQEPKFYRFKVFANGNEKKDTVGMAWLKEGQRIYTIKLWTFLSEKYFLLPSKEDQTKYLIMTREPVRAANSKKKYYWNIVGNAKANPTNGVIELHFDLLGKTTYMSLYPDESKSEEREIIDDPFLQVA